MVKRIAIFLVWLHCIHVTGGADSDFVAFRAVDLTDTATRRFALEGASPSYWIIFAANRVPWVCADQFFATESTRFAFSRSWEATLWSLSLDPSQDFRDFLAPRGYDRSAKPSNRSLQLTAGRSEFHFPVDLHIQPAATRGPGQR